MTVLVHGLRFKTARSISWRLPATKDFPAMDPWVVPAGTAGKVRVVGNEVSFWFDGVTHPWGGPAPTIRKPFAPIPDWMEVADAA
jgi:hypothetical protein